MSGRLRRATTGSAWLVCCTLLAVGLSGAAAAQTKRARPAMQKQINRAIGRGAEALLERYSGKNQWGGAGADLDTTPTALAVYTLLQTGTARDSAAIESAILRIRRVKHRRTYGIACALMALGAHDPKTHRKKIQKLADQLVRTQRSGAWGYPAGEDLSNTQFAVLGLWAAVRAGADVPDKVWVRAAQAMSAYARPEGGFAYHRVSATPTGSMTAAGLGTLAICRAMLDKAGDDSLIDADLERRLDLIAAQGLEWLADNFSGTGNPPHGTGWVDYYLYGTERVGALYNTSRFGKHDWYSEGALYFLAKQGDGGLWGGTSGDVSSTCFALLFLRRATTKIMTAPVSGPVTRAASRDLERLDARDLGRNRAQVAAPEVEASSHVRDHAAALACDGRLDTWWEARPRDEAPKLTIVFERPRKVDTVLISHPRSAEPGLVRALTYSLRINGEETFEVSMPPLVERKGRLYLPVALRIRRLEITLTSIADVEGGERRVGIGEIEIQMRP